jgi:hypothetical protein
VSPDLNFEKLRIKMHKPNSVILLLSFRITKILKLQKNRTLQFDSIWGRVVEEFRTFDWSSMSIEMKQLVAQESFSLSGQVI